MGGAIFLIVIIVIVAWVLASCIRIVPQAYAVILERLGAYQATWSTGIHFKVPFIERVARKVNLKEQVVDFPPQPVITKDNVTMQIDTVVFFQITDPKLYTYGVENPIMAIENLSATTLRNIIGDMELDETLTSRETINTKMRASLDEATDPWGIKVNRVELKNIIPPAAIQDAMEKQMKAERERREAILIAEGQKKSTILVAEGKKQSAILDAEAEKAVEESETEHIYDSALTSARSIFNVEEAEEISYAGCTAENEELAECLKKQEYEDLIDALEDAEDCDLLFVDVDSLGENSVAGIEPLMGTIASMNLPVCLRTERMDVLKEALVSYCGSMAVKKNELTESEEAKTWLTCCGAVIME